MKARWRDGLKKFCRDNNVQLRGERGRISSSRAPGIYDDEIVINKGAGRKAAKKETHKKLRQVLKAELRDAKFLADVYWELYDLGWEAYSSDYLEPEYFSFYDLLWEDDIDQFDDVRHFAEDTGFDHGVADDEDDFDYKIDHGYYRRYDMLNDDSLTVSNF